VRLELQEPQPPGLRELQGLRVRLERRGELQAVPMERVPVQREPQREELPQEQEQERRVLQLLGRTRELPQEHLSASLRYPYAWAKARAASGDAG